MSQSASALYAIPIFHCQLLMKTIMPEVFYHLGHVFHAIAMVFENSNLEISHFLKSNWKLMLKMIAKGSGLGSVHYRPRSFSEAGR